jgi:predicted metalloprotease with PDZ domain
MQVEAEFGELGTGPLELVMSRSSPGRYGAHDFARGVYDVHAYGADGRELRIERGARSEWVVPTHSGIVRLTYKVYGDRLDGTYLAIDPTHAHVNMPAAILWARGLEDRPATLTFEAPGSTRWEVATQLYPGAMPNEFTAPNLQFLIDSPVEFGPIMLEPFAVGPRMFRFAAHHTGTRMELQSLVEDVAEIVAEQSAIFGELPVFETGTYTFIADYLPYAAGDAMEHRNSTVMTSPGTIANARRELLDSVSHEFFHVWNVERIRPRSLEPFDLERTNPSGELWLAEGFTQYYGPLTLQRVGLLEVGDTARIFTMVLNAVSAGAGRLVHSAEEVSRRAVDEEPNGRQPTGVVSYYSLGAAIALALDLSLRSRPGPKLSLDDFMREMWVRFGKPGGSRPGYVDRPYTMADVEATLASLTGDASARDFVGRYIRGHEIADYRSLLAPAGFLVRPAPRGRLEVVPIEMSGGSLTPSQQAFRRDWLGPRPR